MLKILLWHLQAKADDFLGPDQYVFSKGCGTRDAVAALRVMCGRTLENNNEVYDCYVDFENTFDRIKWVKLIAILADIGVDWRDRNLIVELYINQKAFVVAVETLSEACSIRRGVRQGCSLSPLLFIIYDEAMFREICHECASRGER